MSESWNEGQLGDCFVVINDKSIQLKSSEYMSSGRIPIIDQSESFIAGFTDDLSKKFSGPLPVTVFGDHTRHVKYIDFDFAVGADGTQILKPKTELHERFFYYLVCRASNQIGNYGYDRHLKHLRDFQTRYPNSFPEQSKIARILFTVDNLIEKTEALIAKYQAIKQGMMHDLFTRGVDKHGRLRPTYEEAPELYKESELGWIPREWEPVFLETYVGFIRSGLSRRIVEEDIGIPVITSGNIQNETFDASDLRFWYVKDPQGANTGNYILDDYDILLNFINSVEQIGKVCLFRDIKRPCIYTTNIFRIKCNSSTSQEFLYRLLCSSQVQNEIRVITKPAINQASFTTGDFLRIPVPLIGHDEQLEICLRLKQIDKVITAHNKDAIKLREIKTGLMQDLLTGKIRVNPDTETEDV